MPWASHKLRSSATDSKMAALWWRAMLIPVGPQQAEMTRSLTTCGLWSRRTIVSPSTCRGGGDKHWFSTFHFDRWFGHAESVFEIRAEFVTTHQFIPRNWFKLSWPNTTFPWFDRLPTLPTWLSAIFVCSPTWKGLDLSHQTTLYGTRWPSCTPFAKRHSRNALTKAEPPGQVCSVTRRLL
jgi:hypothetical protein